MSELDNLITLLNNVRELKGHSVLLYDLYLPYNIYVPCNLVQKSLNIVSYISAIKFDIIIPGV